MTSHGRSEWYLLNVDLVLGLLSGIVTLQLHLASDALDRALDLRTLTLPPDIDAFLLGRLAGKATNPRKLHNPHCEQPKEEHALPDVLHLSNGSHMPQSETVHACKQHRLHRSAQQGPGR